MNITYLFGAGASKSAIPLNDILINSMDGEFSLIQNQYVELSDEIFNEAINPYLTKKVYDEFVTAIKIIIEESKRHQSIDTYAKKLFIQGKTEQLKKLKTIMSIYFIIIQSKRDTDERYDSFFASILEENYLVFPKDLKILSWNYDYQFEKAFAEYSDDYRLEACKTALRVYSKNTRFNQINKDDFGILKLNGTAAFMLDVSESKVYNSVEKVNPTCNTELLRTILMNYASLHQDDKTKEKLISTISFAWEEYNNGKFIVNKAIEFTNTTEILVVIGYSFPFFNRQVDRDIIRAMGNLKKVYFQAPDAIDLRERFLAIRDDIEQKNLLIRTDVKQFVFPNEF